MNLNLSASLNIFKLIANPSLCLPHAIIPTFKDLPIPLNSAFERKGKDVKVDIKAVVLDKDDCFAIPETNEIHKPYQVIYLAASLETRGFFELITCVRNASMPSELHIQAADFS